MADTPPLAELSFPIFTQDYSFYGLVCLLLKVV
jgi:hypothetical protein